VCPLFNEDAQDREAQAVNSEHEKNINNDLWRLSQLDKSTASPTHPYSKFGTGTLATLVTDPKARAIDVRAALIGFHAMWYSANIMALAVLGRGMGVAWDGMLV
jgi:insulysin